MKSTRYLAGSVAVIGTVLSAPCIISCASGDYAARDGDEAVAVASLASPWASKDIGSPGKSGSATDDGAGTFTVSGGGTDIYGSSDSFQFVYKSISGDATLIAQVQSVSNTNSWAKAGVMIRESLNANSKEMMIALTPGNGITSQKRTTTGGTTSVTSGGSAKAPYYVKISRSGSTITTSKSSNGTTWTTVESTTLNMNSAAYIGMAVTSHNNSTSCSAKFKVVSGTCSSGYHDGGNGVCVVNGTCSVGYHNGGTGACVPTGTCSSGYSLDGSGNCIAGPTVTQQPQDVTVCAGTQATFTTSASGTGPLSYQWYQLVSGTPVAVSKGPSLSISTASGMGSPVPPYANSYYCVVTDASGVQKQSRVATLTVPNPPPYTIWNWGIDDLSTYIPHLWVQIDAPATGCIYYTYSNDGKSFYMQQTGACASGPSPQWPNVGMPPDYDTPSNNIVQVFSVEGTSGLACETKSVWTWDGSIVG